MIAGGLVVQHHVVRTGNAHEIVAARRSQKQQQIVGRILIGGGVICVADIATHRQTEQLAHEMIFEPGADNLPLVVQIFRADEADNAVDQERIERSRHPICPRFQRQLIDCRDELPRKARCPGRFRNTSRCCLPSATSRCAMMLQHPFAAFAQHGQSDSEAAIRRFGAGDGLEKQIDRRAAIHRGELSGDMRQAAGLRGNFVGVDQAVRSRVRIALTVSTDSVAGLTPMTASPQP